VPERDYESRDDLIKKIKLYVWLKEDLK
jgi:hypothetical protein